MIKVNKGKVIGPEINIAVPGQPPSVTHQSGTRIGANHHTYKTPELLGWERRIRDAAWYKKPDEPFSGPVLLIAWFLYDTKDKKKRGTWKETKPDTDNMLKTPKDVLESLGFFEKGDQQSCIEIVGKQWCDDGQEPGMYLTIVGMDRHV